MQYQIGSDLVATKGCCRKLFIGKYDRFPSPQNETPGTGGKGNGREQSRVGLGWGELKFVRALEGG